ncbi:MAG: helix-turn-helix transcriptional regulator [Candidatus Thorarchaeota archaeon]
MRSKTLALTVFVIASLLILPIQGEFVTAQSTGLIMDPIDIKATMAMDGTTTIEVRARTINKGLGAVESLSFRIDSLNVFVITSLVNNTVSISNAIPHERYTEIAISLPQPLDVNESVWIDLQLQATDLQSEPVEGSGLDLTRIRSDFIFYIRPLIEYANFTFTAVLPQDAMLSRESVVPLFPEANSNYTDGATLAFVWFTQSLQPGQEKVFIVKYQVPTDTTGPLQSTILESIIIAVLGVALGIILTLVGPKLLARIRRIGKVRFIGVTTEEEEVLEVIRAKGGSCPQKDLYTEFEMSQAKVSLILNNLEERGLVRRFREGRENVVHIMED